MRRTTSASFERSKAARTTGRESCRTDGLRIAAGTFIAPFTNTSEFAHRYCLAVRRVHGLGRPHAPGGRAVARGHDSAFRQRRCQERQRRRSGFGSPTGDAARADAQSSSRPLRQPVGGNRRPHVAAHRSREAHRGERARHRRQGRSRVRALPFSRSTRQGDRRRHGATDGVSSAACRARHDARERHLPDRSHRRRQRPTVGRRQTRMGDQAEAR